jgi:hypothetical protein
MAMSAAATGVLSVTRASSRRRERVEKPVPDRATVRQRGFLIMHVPPDSMPARTR